MRTLVNKNKFYERELEIINTYRKEYIKIKQDEINQEHVLKIGDYKIIKSFENTNKHQATYEVILTGIKLWSFNQLDDTIQYIKGWD